jgi:hypothetical protein
MSAKAAGLEVGLVCRSPSPESFERIQRRSATTARQPTHQLSHISCSSQLSSQLLLFFVQGDLNISLKSRQKSLFLRKELTKHEDFHLGRKNELRPHEDTAAIKDIFIYGETRQLRDSLCEKNRRLCRHREHRRSIIMNSDDINIVQRPNKRQKVQLKPQCGDSHNASPYRSLTSCSIEYWVKKLSQTRPSHADSIMTVIESIRSHLPARRDRIPGKVLRRLYQSLMLHVGYTSPSMKDEVDGSRLMLVQSLFFCFRDVVHYLRGVDLRQCHAILTPEDLLEVFTLFPRIVLELHDASRVPKISTMYQDITLKTTSAYRDIMVNLFRVPGCPEQLLITGMQDGTTKAFLYSLLAGAACEEGISGNDDVKSVLSFLQASTTASSELRSLSKTATTALSMPAASHETLCLPKEYCQISTMQRVFFWKCITYLYGPLIPQKVADWALDDLFCVGDLSKSDRTSCRESVFDFGEFVPHASGKACLRVIAAVHELLHHQNCQGCNSKTIMGVIDCLGSCIARQDGSKLVVDTVEWSKLFPFLMLAFSTDNNISTTLSHRRIQQDYCSATVAGNAAKIAIPLLRELFFRNPTLQDDTIDIGELMILLLAVLKSSFVPSVEEALDLLLIALDDKNLRRHILACGQARDLTHALAIVVRNETMSGATKGGLTKAFSLLIQEYNCAHIVSREPGIMEFLILTAGENNGIQGLHRGTAVRSLLRLATNPCDRRMLAKMPGLLSSMIRYARGTSIGIEGNHDGTGYSRDEMKKQIFLLARAL